MKSVVILFLLFVSSLAMAGPAKIPAELKSLPVKKLNEIKYDKVEDLKGKIVMLDFWASWCEPCAESLPHYEKLYSKYKDKGLVVLTVNMDGSEKDRDAFLKKFKLNLPIYDDKDRAYSKEFKLDYLPSLFIFDRNLKQVEFYSGFEDKELPALEKRIQALLKN